MKCESCNKEISFFSKKCKYCYKQIDNEPKIILFGAGILLIVLLIFASLYSTSQHEDYENTIKNESKTTQTENEIIYNNETNLNKNYLSNKTINHTNNTVIISKNTSKNESANVKNNMSSTYIPEKTPTKILNEQTNIKVYQNVALNKPVAGTCPSIPVHNWPIVSDYNRITNGKYFSDCKNYPYPPPLNDDKYQYLEVPECGEKRCATVDLKQEEIINEVVVFNGCPAPGYEHIYQVSNVISISRDGKNWENIYNYENEKNHLLIDGPQKVFFKPKLVRFIKQCVDGNNYQKYQAAWVQIEARYIS